MGFQKNDEEAYRRDLDKPIVKGGEINVMVWAVISLEIKTPLIFMLCDKKIKTMGILPGNIYCLSKMCSFQCNNQDNYSNRIIPTYILQI